VVGYVRLRNSVDDPELTRLLPSVHAIAAKTYLTRSHFGNLSRCDIPDAARLHWKSGDQIQGGFLAEEAPIVEIVSETRQAGNAICSF
jgi:hypothetical protein